MRSGTAKRSSAGTSGVGGGGAQLVEVRPVLAGELDHVGEAGGREQRGARGAALEQRVRRDGHAVREALDVAGARAGAARSTPAHRLEHRERTRSEGVDGTFAVWTVACVVDEHRVGEGAADVDAQEHVREHYAAASSRSSVSARCWWEGQ